MAQFMPKKLNATTINSGQRFSAGDGVTPDAINGPIEASLYMQALATNQPDITNIGQTGTPKVSIEEVDGLPRFKFENLKGADGTDLTAEVQALTVQVRENTIKTETLKNVLLKTGEIVVLPVTQAYTSRETGDGVDIIDGATDVMEIKGSTVRCENLIPYPYVHTTITKYGVTFTDNGDGTVTVTTNGGKATSTTTFALRIHTTDNPYFKIGHTYSLSDGTNGATVSTYYVYITGVGADGIPKTLLGTFSKSTYTCEEELRNVEMYIAVIEGATINNVTIKPMLNEGPTSRPYQPYFTGLKNANIEAIKSTGHNFVPPPPYNYPEGTYAGITYKVNSDGSVTANGTATSTSFFALALGVHLLEGDYYISDGVNMGFAAHMRWGNMNYNRSFHSSGETHGIEIRVDAGTVLNNVTFKPMINRGTTALPYEPYTEEIYQLPQTLELPEWDRVNPQTGELVRQTETMTLDGSKAWTTTIDDGSVAGWYSKPEHWYLYNKYTDDFFISSKALLGSASAYNFQKTFPSGTALEEVQAYYDGIVVAGKLKTPTTETIANAPKSYKVHNHGSETVVQGETDNSKFGAMPAITNEYITLLEV